MGYQLHALLTHQETARAAAPGMPEATLFALDQGVTLIPMTHPLLAQIEARLARPAARVPLPFEYLTPSVAAWCGQSSAAGLVTYVEAGYFGGNGTQCAAAWDRGGSLLAPFEAPDAVNQALRLLGVRAHGDQDEFDTLALGRYRRTRRWVEVETSHEGQDQGQERRNIR